MDGASGSPSVGRGSPSASVHGASGSPSIVRELRTVEGCTLRHRGPYAGNPSASAPRLQPWLNSTCSPDQKPSRLTVTPTGCKAQGGHDLLWIATSADYHEPLPALYQYDRNNLPGSYYVDPGCVSPRALSSQPALAASWMCTLRRTTGVRLTGDGDWTMGHNSERASLLSGTFSRNARPAQLMPALSRSPLSRAGGRRLCRRTEGVQESDDPEAHMLSCGASGITRALDQLPHDDALAPAAQCPPGTPHCCVAGASDMGILENLALRNPANVVAVCGHCVQSAVGAAFYQSARRARGLAELRHISMPSDGTTRDIEMSPVSLPCHLCRHHNNNHLRQRQPQQQTRSWRHHYHDQQTNHCHHHCHHEQQQQSQFTRLRSDERQQQQRHRREWRPFPQQPWLHCSWAGGGGGGCGSAAVIFCYDWFPPGLWVSAPGDRFLSPGCRHK